MSGRIIAGRGSGSVLLRRPLARRFFSFHDPGRRSIVNQGVSPGERRPRINIRITCPDVLSVFVSAGGSVTGPKMNVPEIRSFHEDERASFLSVLLFVDRVSSLGSPRPVLLHPLLPDVQEFRDGLLTSSEPVRVFGESQLKTRSSVREDRQDDRSAQRSGKDDLFLPAPTPC